MKVEYQRDISGTWLFHNHYKIAGVHKSSKYQCDFWRLR